jgi:hypothetical protein
MGHSALVSKVQQPLSKERLRDAKLGFLVVTNAPFRENARPDELEARFFEKLEGAVDVRE